MSNLVLLKWHVFEYKAKFEKKVTLIYIIEMINFLKDCTMKIQGIVSDLRQFSATKSP